MTRQDYQDNMSECKQSMSEYPWAIVALYDGKVGGARYGYEVQTGDQFLDCHERHTFIMTNHENVDQDLTC